MHAPLPLAPRSRAGASFDDVPCAVSLSHLVVVFEVVVPILTAFVFEQARRSAGDDPAPPSAAAAGGDNGSGAAGAADAGASAAQALPRRQASQRRGAAQGGHSSPSALLVMLFGLGLSGVLFDLALTWAGHMGIS